MEESILTSFTRFVLYTLAWCLFPPLFFVKNRGWQVTLHSNDPLTALISWSVCKRIWRLVKRGRILSAVELFWSKWNPLCTAETTQPLYHFCGGNKRPVLATLVCFAYSAVVLHWLGGGFTWVWLYMFIHHGLSGLSFGLMQLVFYPTMGCLIALSKFLRRAKLRKSRTRAFST